MTKMQIKAPKGTRDWNENDMALRNEIFEKIRKVFALHSGVEIDTPVFELKSLLTDKYGEDSKLIYDLKDQDGELCALRYDLTVPFARWLAMNNTRNIKRFQIGKVYRRDQPSIARGRMREFFQCDFDYAGEMDLMVPDAEVLCITTEVFEALEIPVTIRINHRLILDGLFSAVGVPEELLRAISSAVDKLDKLPWEKVKEEMIQKGLDADVAVELGEYLSRADHDTDTDGVLQLLKSDPLLSNNKDIQKGVGEIELLLRYLKAYGVAHFVQLDLSLARGLDYYSGLIYEVVLDPDLKASEEKRDQLPKEALSVCSIAAGGRYDSLVGKFSSRDIPCVGISFGIDRILTVLKAIEAAKRANMDSNTECAPAPAKPRVHVWIVIASSNPILVDKRMAIAGELRRSSRISVDFDTKADKKPKKQMDVAEKNAKHVLYLEEVDQRPGSVRVKLLDPTDRDFNNARILDDWSSQFRYSAR
jgi:histidyl-tRNA synthetase